MKPCMSTVRCAASITLMLTSIGCRASLPASRSVAASSPTPPSIENQLARDLLCGDIGEPACLATCADDASPREHAECLLQLRFATDPEALGFARALYLGTNTLVGLGQHRAIDGYDGEEVALFPTLPIGDERHHLQWLNTSLAAFDRFIGSIAEHAPRAVRFQPRPKAFVFFRTETPTYPSAYCSDGLIGYNLKGPLHEDPRDVHETLFHELFHLNDAAHRGWSTAKLKPVFDSIIERCGADHDCLSPFAPHHTVVPDGTYYAFDERTRDVKEYAAELALRYFLEHEAILAGAPKLPPFKCRTEQNRLAWDGLVDEFFGGADLSPPCDEPILPEGARP